MSNFPILKTRKLQGRKLQLKIAMLWTNSSSAKIVPEINLAASFIENSFYFKMHVSTGNVFQTMNTFALFRAGPAPSVMHRLHGEHE